MEREFITQASAGQRGTQTQHALLTCLPDRELVKQLAEEATQHLTEVGGITTLLSYGITPKQQHGYIVLEAARGIPLRFFSWLQNEPDITDYLVYDVSSFEQERMAVEECGVYQYEPRLEAPDLPRGYSLLTEPISLDRPSDELWMAHVRSDKQHEGEGILVYGEDHQFFFFTAEETMNIIAYLCSQITPLLASCSPEFLQAPQHAGKLMLVRQALIAIKEGHADGEQ